MLRHHARIIAQAKRAIQVACAFRLEVTHGGAGVVFGEDAIHVANRRPKTTPDRRPPRNWRPSVAGVARAQTGHNR